MTLPDWLNAYAALDDDALAVLANRGLARRAAKEAGRLDDGIDPPWMTAPPEDADVPENTPSTSPRQ